MSKRSFLGRRKTDWIIPLILLFLVGLVAIWAIDNRIKKHDAEAINQSLNTQVKLQERELKHMEKHSK